MQVTREDISPCLVSLEIHVDADQYAAAIQKAKKDLGKRTEVPGFRKGKAPMPILEKVLDPERVTELAREYVVPEVVEQALKDENLDPFDVPSVEMIEESPLSGIKFKTSVPLEPTVELGQYEGLSVDRIVRPVTDDVINAELERLQKQHTRLEPKEEGTAEDGDYAFVSIVELDESGEPMGEPGYNTAVVGENVPDFDANIKGMAKDETKEFTISYPQDWGDAERAGKTVNVRATVTLIYKQIKPEMDDEFAKSAGGMDSVDELRAEIQKMAERAFAEMADDQVDNELLQQIVQASTVHYPPPMMEYEFRHRVQDMFQELQQRGMTFEQYLQETNRSEEQFRQQLEARIDHDIRVGLVMGEISQKTGLTIEPQELKQEVDRLLEGELTDEERERVSSKEGQSSLARRMLFRKTLEYLRAASNIKNVAHTESDSADEQKEA